MTSLAKEPSFFFIPPKKFTVGNATLATAITLFVTGMAAFFPKIANFIAALSTMVGAIFTGDGEAFGKAVGENISGLFFLGLFLARKYIIKSFRGIFLAKILPALSLFYGAVAGKLALVAGMINPVVLIGIISGFLITLLVTFFDEIVAYFKRTSASQMIADIVTIIFDGIKKVFSTIGDIIKFFVGGGETTKPLEPKAMGGPVAAGTPYIVGEKGPELFVPGAAGGIVPNMGGGNIVVNNNQVNQSASSATHQHSNVTIVDRQQEQVGL